MSPDELNLIQSLRKESAAFVEFERLLDEECQALVSGSPEALLLVVNKKTALAETLNNLAEDRVNCLRSLSVDPNDNAAVADWFERRHPKDALLVEWQKLLELGRSVVARNASNGKLIHQRLESTQDALHVLQKAAGSPGLYGPDGKIKSPFLNKGY